MSDSRPKILLTFRIGGENGGPYISHKRIMESSLSKKYDFEPLMLENPRKLRNPKIFFKTVKQIKQAMPALVHLAGLQSEGFLIMFACRMAGVKTVVAVHGSSTEAIGYGKIANLIFRFIEKYTVNKADAVYGVSDYVSSWKVCKCAKHYCGTIYNIADFEKTEYTQPYVRKELGISNDDIVIVSTGRITKDKGFDILWEIIKQLKEIPNIKFVIAGDGNYKEEWLSEIKQQGFDNKVFLLGYRNDIDNILKESNIFIICTKHETLCISLLEAGINSLPLIASDVGGIPEIIEDGKNGFLIPVGDEEGFKEKLLKLISEGELRKEIGEAARNYIKDKFEERKIVAKLDNVYRKVIGEKM